MPKLTFEANGHRYLWADRPVPSVTQILDSSFPFQGRGMVAQRAADFGTAVHKAIELKFNGKLDESSLDDSLIPYINQFENFTHQVSNFQLISSETRLYSKAYGYAGTIDLVCSEVYDVKTGSPSPVHRAQVAAYRRLWNENNKVKIKRSAIIYLDGTDKEPEIVYEKPSDFGVFLACLEIYKFKKVEGV